MFRILVILKDKVLWSIHGTQRISQMVKIGGWRFRRNDKAEIIVRRSTKANIVTGYIAFIQACVCRTCASNIFCIQTFYSARGNSHVSYMVDASSWMYTAVVRFIGRCILRACSVERPCNYTRDGGLIAIIQFVFEADSSWVMCWGVFSAWPSSRPMPLRACSQAFTFIT